MAARTLEDASVSGGPPGPQLRLGLQFRKLIMANFKKKSDTIESRKKPPPVETLAEVYYYRKQIDSRTEMVMILQDGEEVRGTIEWYDLDALKINRKDKPNILLPKHSIKYMYKADDREG